MTAQFKSWLARLTLIVALVGVSTLTPHPAVPVMAQAVPGIGAPICFGFALSAFTRATTSVTAVWSRTTTLRALPFSSK